MDCEVGMKVHATRSVAFGRDVHLFGPADINGSDDDSKFVHLIIEMRKKTSPH